MKKILLLICMLLIMQFTFSQKSKYFYEDIFIEKITKKYKKYEQKYKSRILKVVLDSIWKESFNEDSFDVKIIPIINYKKLTKRKWFVSDTTRFFYFLNPNKLYFGDAYIFYKKKYIGHIVIGKSFEKPALHFVKDNNFYSFLITEEYNFDERNDFIKFQIHNRCGLIFFINNNRVCYYDIRENKIYKNIEELDITHYFGFKWYGKIKYIGAK